MDVLLHSCCAPCAIKCVEALRNEGIEPSVLWLNPNIHPYTEYISRRDALLKLCNEEKLNLVYSGEYGLRPFLNGLNTADTSRCEYCYDMRLDAAASNAKLNGYEAFSTTLLISPYQDHELIRTIGCKKAEKYGIQFLYRDFRPLFRQGQDEARARGMYMQKYCGCIFSEEERYSRPYKAK